MAVDITIDKNLCSGYGNCVVAAPDVFDLDDGTMLASVREGHPTDDDLEPALEAEADCPVRAIRVSNSQ